MSNGFWNYLIRLTFFRSAEEVTELTYRVRKFGSSGRLTLQPPSLEKLIARRIEYAVEQIREPGGVTPVGPILHPGGAPIGICSRLGVARPTESSGT